MQGSWKKLYIAAAFILTLALIAGCGAGSSGTPEEPTQQAAGGTNGQDQAQPEEQAQPEAGGEVNIYTARHYDVDAELYSQFTEATGITVNVIEGKAPELIEKLKREGASTPADLFITVDGGILNTAKVEGLLQPIESEVIDAQVGEGLMDTDKEWIGLSTRARVIVYAKDRVDPAELSTYEALAEDNWQGKVLVRSSTNLYNQSLLASLIAIDGEEAAEQWAAGIAANLAREPEGGDRDQAKAVVAGAGDVAIMNTYYVGQMSVSDDPEEVKVAEQVGVFFPNQDTTGTHINISGAGLIKHSKNKDNAVKLIEFLTAPAAQETISLANYEYPVNAEAKLPELLASWGEFKHQELDFAVYGENNPKAVEIANKVGWK
ncbi:Fe(3+) ABC transporter substrate-binding protein [Paenibacillus daejeonensis]|uniref:Fe(3+) ABC transporter substrate-binding protein n=1 Tax=Paenibacillus daejeonensis TaxID=135193 RepID=UPI0003738279|nr:Fe(3+) ABC transporter substrate-binding protein [Paenibacillus daejeonensis]